MKDELINFYANRYPERKDVTVLDLEQISLGWENEVYSFSLEYDEKHEDLILRIYPGDDALGKSTREFNVMKQLKDSGYPVPEVFILETEKSPFSKPFVIMEKINGPLLIRVIEESPEDKQKELISVFSRLFVDLHILDWKPFTRDPSQYASGGLATVIKKELSNWEKLVHSFEMNEFDPVFAWLWDRIDDIHWLQPSLIHMDFHPLNIILNEEGKPFVIDWTSAQVADSRLDLAWTLLLMSTHASQETSDTIRTLYESISGHKVEQLEYFDVAVCLRRLFSITVSFKHGPEKLGMRPGATEMMKQHVDPLKKVHTLLTERTGISIPETEQLLSDMSK